MSHQDVAALWLTLHGRSDINNIVQELTGSYCLQISQCATNRVQLRVKTFELIVALRAIFDLQRTYLQASTLSLEAKSSLLSPATLWSSLSYLLDLKISVFDADDELPDHNAYCSFIGQTQLSGLRALLLHDHHVSPEDFKTFSLRYRQAWKSEHLSDTDHFTINLLGLRLLAELSNQALGTRYSKAACGTVKLPDFYENLMPAKERDNAVINTTRDVVANTRNLADWFDGALILYDTSWSTIAALIQLCMKIQAKKQSGQWTFSEEAIQLNDLHTILLPRFKMLDELYTPSKSRLYQENIDGPQEQIKTMLCLAIHPTCYLHNCTCLTEERPGVHKSWLQHKGQDTSIAMVSHISKLRYLDIHPVLRELRKIFEFRNSNFPDFVKELNLVSQKMIEYVQEWCPESATHTGTSGQPGPVLDDLFVINCPDLHAISSQSLFPNTRQQRQEVRDRKNSNSVDNRLMKDLPSHIRCTQCSWSSEAMTVRKVEPLSKLSDYVHDRLRTQRELVKARLDELARSESHSDKIVHEPTPPLSNQKKSLPTPSSVINQEQRTMYRAPKIPNLGPIDEVGHTTSESVGQKSPQKRILQRAATESGLLIPSPTSRYSSSTLASSTSSPAFQSSQTSHSSSRTFSLPLLPSQSQPQSEYSTLPEVVGTVPLTDSKRSPAISVRSAESSIRSPERKSVWGMFKSGRGALAVSSTPAAKFYSSGKAIILWNELGAVVYEVENVASAPHQVVAIGDVLLAAGGAETCAVVIKAGPVLILRVFKGDEPVPMIEIELEEIPFRMAISRNDQFLALKFGNIVRIVNLVTGSVMDHLLPAQRGRSGPNDHLIAFSTDQKWFVAVTRCEPEQVITYSCACENPSKGVSVESTAPYGLMGDDGLSSIIQSGNAAFLTTFTEKGYPAYLHLSQTRPSSRILRDKGQQIGSRIHGTAACSTGQNLVLMNDRNDVFWIVTPFGKEQVPTRIGNVKRTRSVKREVELGMSSSDQVHIFWVEKGKGVLMTFGRGGGKSKPVEFIIAMDQLLEA